jgi:DNA ligase-1
VELGIGEALIIKALAEACGRKEKEVKKQYKVIAFCVYVGGFVFC